MEGYIKLYRKLLDNPVFHNEKLLKVFIWCLLKASHSEHEQLVGLQKITLKPGQFVFGRLKAAEELHMKESTVYKYMMMLQTYGICNIKSNNRFSVVSIVNWELYQLVEENCNSKSNNKITTKEQQNNTNKNDKNVNNDKNNNRDIYIGIISNFTADENLKKTIMDFIEMRQQKKKPPTKRALNIILKKASEMSSDIQTQIKIFEQSIVNGWTDIYPLKNQRQDKPLGNIFLREDV